MREILSSGVTGILVSHSLAQVRELCNRVLWLDHGKQIYFGDEVELYCDAYEQFLVNKKIPSNRDEAIELADEYHVKLFNEKKEKDKKEVEKLEKAMAEGSDNAVKAALNIIKKNKPELLK